MAARTHGVKGRRHEAHNQHHVAPSRGILVFNYSYKRHISSLKLLMGHFIQSPKIFSISSICTI